MILHFVLAISLLVNGFEPRKKIKLCAQQPPLSKMDKAFANLQECETLSLSTNAIDRIGSLAGMSKLKILSLGRNNIKKIEKLEEVSSTLEQLWISYNQIASRAGIEKLQHLQVTSIPPPVSTVRHDPRPD